MDRLWINPRRLIGRRDRKIYGQFLEHFHRQVYGGVFEPGSTLCDERGFRTDVIEALRRIGTPVVRWPGGCFVSAYHWKDGIGARRLPSFDKAWRVEESNAFGTDEFIELCRSLDCEPYICTNAGSGTPEEMADWVEYCNLDHEGRWARERIANGHPEPHAVKYWSIGNENYFDFELGAKKPAEWARFVRESAKMMRRVDPSIEILAPSTDDVHWSGALLAEAGDLLSWVSIHGYWDALSQENKPSRYEDCMAQTAAVDRAIRKTEHVLGAMGYLGRIRIAFDEWNLRGWHHPNVVTGRTAEEYLAPRDQNDRNEDYTMADAVFSACFLNECLRHCTTVGMANFAPAVNTRGCIYAFPGGIVVRPSYHVFDLFANRMGDSVVDSWLESEHAFEAEPGGTATRVASLDAVATVDGQTGQLRVSVVNRHPDRALSVEVDAGGYSPVALSTLAGPDKDACNTIARPDAVRIESRKPGRHVLELDPHSVNVLVLEVQR
jgi:alpha-L-arabinofuranosidase